MLRTRTKSNTNDTNIKGGESSGSAFKGIKGKHHSHRRKKQILNLCIGFAIVFILGAFFSLFVYDIEDLEEASSSVSFRDAGRGEEVGRRRRSKRRERREEEKEKPRGKGKGKRGGAFDEESSESIRERCNTNCAAIRCAFEFRAVFRKTLERRKRRIVSVPVRFRSFLLFARLRRVFQ